MTQTRRLAAILAADVASYSRLIGADEGGTLRRLRAIRDELVDPAIATHHGRLVKTTGDGLLIEFGSVVDGLRCASEIQAGMAERNATVPQDQRIDFRMGLNVGDVVVEDGDIFGDGVNVAARLEALAEPGGICVSARVQEDAAGKLDLSFEDMGEQQLKNIGRPVRAYRMRSDNMTSTPSAVIAKQPRLRRKRRGTIAMGALAAIVIPVAGWWSWPQGSTPAVAVPKLSPEGAPAALSHPASRLSIVVLPFANLSNDPDQQYFADGITEDMTTALSRITHMFVIARTTAFTYRDKPVKAKQVGRELGVRYVLEGSVRRSGDQVRVAAQLIDAETEGHVWAERFDHAMADLFALQTEITGRIAVALDLELSDKEAARSTENPDALDYILRARAVWSKPEWRGGLPEIINLYERALALDPGSVEAQSLLAITLVTRVREGMAADAAIDIERAKKLVAQTLAAAPRAPLAHQAKGTVLRAEHRYEEAIPEYETVIDLDRNWWYAYSDLAQCKFFTGALEEAIPLWEQAIRLSPRDPQNGSRYSWVGRAYLLQSRTDKAILWLERARNANTRDHVVHAYLASAYALSGQTASAAAELADARRLIADDRYSNITRLKAVALGGYWGAPKVSGLFEATYFAGLRKAGLPEE